MENNRGVLFHNEKKMEKSPDLTGEMTVDGKEYFVSAWINVSKSGKKYISMSLNAKTARKTKEYKPVVKFTHPEKPIGSYEGLDDTIPF